MSMKINVDIPGWMSERDLQLIATLASLVPEHGSILEIGSFLGKSTFSLVKNKSSSVKVSVIDPFDATGFYHTKDEHWKFRPQGNESLLVESISLAKKYNTWLPGFKHCLGKNIIDELDINVCSSENFKKTKDFDLVFVDGDHTEPAVSFDISKFITNENLIFGDDFGEPYERFKGLIDSVIRAKIVYNRNLVILQNSRIWMLIPNTGFWHTSLIKEGLIKKLV